MHLRFFKAAWPLVACAVLPTLSPAAPATESASTPTPEPTQKYTDGGSITTNTTSYYSSNDYGYRTGSNFYSGFTNATVTTYFKSITFPPLPPALGDAVPTNNVKTSLAKFAPSNTLNAYVYEPFYAPLSPLLFSEDMSRRRRDRLDSFRASRATLVAELRAKLDSVAGADADTRRRTLAEFAQQQTPAIVALEKLAEEMRENFAHGGLFESGSDWNDTRRWRLGDNTRWESHLDEIKVMRGAAYFQDGLSPAQRRLLRELHMELIDSVAGPARDIALTTPGPYFYFTPETARIRLPADLPPELTAKIDAYSTLKASLKKELRDVVYTQDRTLFDFKRANAFRALSDQQAPRFAELDALAEEIRAGLVNFPNPARPPALQLPKDLVTRLAAYLQKKTAWQRAVLGRTDAIKRDLPNDRVELVRVGLSYEIAVVAARRSSDAENARRSVITAELAAFNRTESARYTEIAQEKERLRSELVKTASKLSGVSNGGKSIEQLLAEFNYAFGLQERWDLFRDYETAVLEPGLSPEQRRLLFGAALEKLDLPPGSSLIM